MIFIDALKYSYETIFRTFPVPVNTGLKIFGTPDNTSPIFVTGNFSLTVRMMSKMLRNHKINAYLLVANTSGVNVWCAAGGGHFSAMEIIAVIKTTNIGDVTSQRKLILPQLSASGVNVKKIRRKTGFKSIFGPVHLEDIPQFLKLGRTEKATSQMKKIRFRFREKLEMGVGAGLWPAVLFGLPALILELKTVMIVVVMAYLLTTLYTVIAGSIHKTLGLAYGAVYGLLSATVFNGVLINSQIIISPISSNSIASLLGWTVLYTVMGTMIAFDFPSWSPLHTQCKFHKIMKKLFPKTVSPVNFTPQVNDEKCIGVGICMDVCPIQALEMNEHKIPVVDFEACVSCFACAQQCPVDAIPMITGSLGTDTASTDSIKSLTAN